MEDLKEKIENFVMAHPCASNNINSGADRDPRAGAGFTDFFNEGHGLGCGSGSGFIDYSGEGRGRGSGSGYFDCSGDSFGLGRCYGIKELNGQSVYELDGIPTIIKSVHGKIAKGYILEVDFTLGPCFIVKQENYFAHGKTLHEAITALKDKIFEGMSEEERIINFVNHHEWGKLYTAIDFYEWHHRLTGSCDIGRRLFAEEHGFEVTENEKLTVEDFINLTENSYGGNVIQKLREAYTLT